MYWTPVVVGLTGLACVSGAQERAIGDVLAGAPSTFRVSECGWAYADW